MDNLLFIRKICLPVDISPIWESTPGNKAFIQSQKNGGDNIKPECEVSSISTSEKKELLGSFPGKIAVDNRTFYCMGKPRATAV